MNIANIFGLHIGCKVKFKEDGKIYELIYVGKCEDEIPLTLNDGECGLGANPSEVKLLLKPLSAITDDDKAEFMEKFYPIDSIFWRYMRIVSFQASGLDVYSTRYNQEGECPYCQLVAYTYQQALFLSTKGYKIEGIVPDEYCEVEE